MKIVRLTQLALLLGLSLPAGADAMTCSINSVTGLNFGSYDVFSGASLDTAGSISYRCDNVLSGDIISIELSPGSSGTYGARTLRSGALLLTYNIFLDPAHASVWGDGTSGTSRIGPLQPPDATVTEVQVYGGIGPRQNARTGDYSDTVVVTIVF